jgi:hypothetical protein
MHVDRHALLCLKYISTPCSPLSRSDFTERERTHQPVSLPVTVGILIRDSALSRLDHFICMILSFHMHDLIISFA